jgi:hypothetical protein
VLQRKDAGAIFERSTICWGLFDMMRLAEQVLQACGSKQGLCLFSLVYLSEGEIHEICGC